MLLTSFRVRPPRAHAGAYLLARLALMNVPADGEYQGAKVDEDYIAQCNGRRASIRLYYPQ